MSYAPRKPLPKPLPKRPRHRSPSAPDMSEENDRELYFSDGNVVLRADCSSEDESGVLSVKTTVFRVHRSVLSSHSSVLRRLLAPSPLRSSAVETKPDDLHDGAPVYFFDDDANDLRNLLSIIYDPFSFAAKLQSPDFVVSMLGPLKLATKYKIEVLRQQIVQRIQVGWPNTLQEYEKRRKAFPTADLLLPDAIALVVQGNIQDEVPSELALMHYELNAAVLREPTTAARVDPNNYRVLFWARQRLDAALMQWPPLILNCQNQRECSPLNFSHPVYMEVNTSACRLTVLQEIIARLSPKDGSRPKISGQDVCAPCAVKMIAYFEKTREDYFRLLPEVFKDIK